jgi:hypothetical protein
MVTQVVESFPESQVSQNGMSLRDDYLPDVSIPISELGYTEDPVINVLKVDESIFNLEVTEIFWGFQDLREE